MTDRPRNGPFALATAPLGPGTVLLEASAGTGKTYALAGLVLRLLLEEEIEAIGEALVVTFTIAATEELKTRLRGGLRRAIEACSGATDEDPFFHGLRRHGEAGARRLRAALADLDQLSVMTIHGFCKRVLEEAAFESGEPFDTDFVDDEIPLLRAAAQDALRRQLVGEDVVLAAAARHAGLSVHALVRDYRLWQRYPDTALRSVASDLAAARGALQGALAAATAAFDGVAGERLAALQFRAGASPFGADLAAAPAWLAQKLTAESALALQTLCALAPAELAAKLLKNQETRLAHPFFAACGEVQAAATALAAALRAAVLRAMHDALARGKRRENVRTFQDLLDRTHRALHDDAHRNALIAAVQARWRVALVDEFQDTDPLQYSIFRACFRGRPLFLVGDPKQSIYSFRGADVDAYLEARGEADSTFTLATNYRSSGALVRAVQQLFGRARPFVTPGIDVPSVTAAAKPGELQLGGEGGAALRWRFVPPRDKGTRSGALWTRDEAEARIVADVRSELVRLLRSGPSLDGAPLRPEHVAVLTRTNAQAVAVQDALREAGVHSAIGRAGDIFDTDELTEIERLLAAVLQPRNLEAARAAFATRLWGMDVAAIAALETDDRALEDALLLLDRCRREWLRHGLVAMIESAFAELSVRARLLERNDGERRLTNFLQLVELLHEAEHELRLSPEGLLQWLQHERQHKAEIDYQRRELRLESDDDAVKIDTVHGTKGLQYEVVFCPFLWHGRQPAQAPALLVRSGNARALEFDVETDSEAGIAAEMERLAEDLRLCYVGLTRAKRLCVVHWGGLRGAQYGALAYLLAGPTDLARPDWQSAWTKELLDGVPAWRTALEALVASSAGTMSLDDVPAAPAVEPLAGPARERQQPDPRRPTREPRPLQLHSFTSLTAPIATTGATIGATTIGAAADWAPRDVLDPPGPGEAAPSRGIFAFARGARAGQCLHAILERADLERAAAPETERLAAATLRRYGLLDASAHAGELEPLAVVLQSLADLSGAVVPSTPTSGPTTSPTTGPTTNPTVARVCAHGSAEWEFTLPAARAPLGALEALFASLGSAAARDYCPQLRALPQRVLGGFLSGFADRIALHGERCWLFDWKTNHLGDDVTSYGADALAACMREHDYVLQYHLYTLALHRHLRSRRRDYDYDRHFGGVCYAFLRGVRAGTSSGLFVDRPPKALVEALDRWLAGEEIR